MIDNSKYNHQLSFAGVAAKWPPPSCSGDRSATANDRQPGRGVPVLIASAVASAATLSAQRRHVRRRRHGNPKHLSALHIAVTGLDSRDSQLEGHW